MNMTRLEIIRVFFCLLCCAVVCSRENLQKNTVEEAQIDFEPFLWGTATAAYQIEGASSADGRGPSIWDEFSHTKGKIANGDTGDVAADSYHLYEQDIALMKNLGVNSYRFSISWSRILPNGTGSINQRGVEYYNRLIDALVVADIQPVATLYHWDMPLALQKRYNGMLSRSFIDDFVYYADVCFDMFNDRVRKWITFNEPWTVAYGGYGSGVFAPGRCSNRDACSQGNTSTEPYIAGHNLLLAHSKAMERYNAEYKHKTYNYTKHSEIAGRSWLATPGMIGITLNLDWAEPYTPRYVPDMLAANRHKDFQLGWFLDPIIFGAYPASMVENVGDRLPVFTEEEKARLLNNRIDFLGLNHYSTKYYVSVDNVDVYSSNVTYFGNFTAQLDAYAYGGWAADQRSLETKYSPSGMLIGAQAASDWLNNVPWGFYNTIMYVHTKYGVSNHAPGLLIYITENGCDAPHEDVIPLPDVLNDTFRMSYFQGYLAALDRAIGDGANVAGYFAWSLLDNFEWADGYSKRFGLHYVDFNSKFKDRYVKQSATWLKSYIGAHRNTYKGKAYIIPPIHTPLPPTTPNLPDEPSNDNNPPNSPAPPATPSLLPCDADVSCTWLDYLYTAINVYADNIRSSIYSQQSLAPSAD